MKKVFISYSRKDTELITKIEQRLKNNFILTWIDFKDMEHDKNFWENILKGMSDTQIFMPFINENFLNSENGPFEMNFAFNKSRRHDSNLNILPVVFLRDPIEQRAMLKNTTHTIQSIVDDNNFFFDMNDVDASIEKLINRLYTGDPLRIKGPIFKNIDGTTVQEIEICNLFEKDYSPDLLKTWRFDLQYFIEQSPGDEKAIRKDIPLAINGGRPNWLVSYLCVPLFNKVVLYIYNAKKGTTGYYVCTSGNGEDEYIGDVLVPETKLVDIEIN